MTGLLVKFENGIPMLYNGNEAKGKCLALIETVEYSYFWYVLEGVIYMITGNTDFVNKYIDESETEFSNKAELNKYLESILKTKSKLKNKFKGSEIDQFLIFRNY